MKGVSVTFMHSYSPYNYGDIATFPEDKATALVKSGRAVYTSKPKAAAGADVGGEPLEPNQIEQGKEIPSDDDKTTQRRVPVPKTVTKHKGRVRNRALNTDDE